jgi:hypothetical protein
MRRRLWWGIAIAAVVVGAPIVWYLGSPLFISRVVSEEFPMSGSATIPEGMTKQQVEETMASAAQTTVEAAEAMPPAAAAAVPVARGTFTGADGFHRGQGTATVYRLGDGLILRFEDFQVTNGPDLHVILAAHAAPKSSADVRQGYVEIAKLKGNVGEQNYTLPAGLRLEDYRTVVIYCQPFHVVFATAPLAAP